MTEQECIERMVAPGTRRPGKYLSIEEVLSISDRRKK